MPSSLHFLGLIYGSTLDIGILSIVQQRGSLLVCWYDSSLTSNTNLLAKDSGNCDEQGGNEKCSHDGEGEYPLERKSLGKKLSNSEGCRQDAESEAHGVILPHVRRLPRDGWVNLLCR